MDLFYKQTPHVRELCKTIREYFKLGKKEIVLKPKEFNVLLDAIHPQQRPRYTNEIPYMNGHIRTSRSKQ